MINFIELNDSSFASSLYFLLYVWLIPIMTISSLAAAEEEKNADGSSPHTLINQAISKILKSVNDIMPHNSDKLE